MAETPAPWLNGSEQAAWRGLLDMWQLLGAQLGRELQKDQGLSHADYQVLVCLSEAPDRRVRMSDLSARTLLSRSRLSHQIRRMEEAGLVTREECPTDRRGAFAVLTDRGWDTITAAAPGHARAVRAHVFNHLTEEQVRQLIAIVSPIVAHLHTTEVGSLYQPLCTSGTAQCAGQDEHQP